MGGESIYEKGHPNRTAQETGIAFGRITRVFPADRLCEVKTFGSSGPKDDNHIPKCQWINMDASPEGDESTSMPRVNSYGLVFFVGGEPFIFGFFSPLTGTGSAQLGDKKEELNEGDKILKTVGKNKIILRSHGEIEIQSTDACRTIYFPDNHLINTLCRNYEFRTDGGTIDWVNLGDGTTLSKEEFRDDIDRSNVIIVERGKVSGEVISRVRIGVGTAAGIDQPVYEHSVKNTGEVDLFVHAPGAAAGHKLNIKPTGATELNIADKAKFTIGADGKTVLDIGPGQATLTINPDGSLNLDLKGTATVKTGGAVNVDAGGPTLVKVAGTVKVEASGKATIKASKIDLDGGGGLEKVLTTPSAISDFTGAPIQVGSSSVQASN